MLAVDFIIMTAVRPGTGAYLGVMVSYRSGCSRQYRADGHGAGFDEATECNGQALRKLLTAMARVGGRG